MPTRRMGFRLVFGIRFLKGSNTNSIFGIFWYFFPSNRIDILDAKIHYG